VTDKDAKVNFLAKLITIIEATTGQKVGAKPNVIVTGAEPENTAEMLIKLAACAKVPKDKQEAAIKKANGGGGGEAKKEAAPAAAPAPAPAPKKEEEAPKPKPKEEEKPKKEDRPKEEAPKKDPPPPAPAAAEEEKPKRRPPPPTTEEPSAVPQVVPLGQGIDPGARPGTASARKPPPALKSNEVVEDRSEIKAGPNAAVILESKDKDDKKSQEERDWQAVVEEEEQANARARESGKGGDKAAKGYLGKAAQDAMKEQEEKEAKERAEAEAAGRKAEGIVLQSKRRGDKAGGGLGEGELTKLREQLQLLTKATNPLGKFLEAIHEDVDTMSRELEMWRTEARTQAVAAQEAQRQTEDSLREIHAKLQTVEDQISDQILKINITRQTILTNDQTIETLLRMVVNPEVGGAKKAGK
jgi:TRAF3-interacting protein 1